MNNIIRRLLENGLITKWIREQFNGSLSRSLSERKYFEKNLGLPTSDRNNIVITYRHISGALIILYIGYITATVVFFIEILIRLKAKVFQQKSHQTRKCQRFVEI